MNYRITLLLTAVLVLCMMATQASAQRMTRSPEERTKSLTDSLSLTKEQSAKVLKIYQEMEQKRQELFDSGAGDREARREAMRSLTDEANKKIETLLTEKQQTKYKEMVARWMERRPGRMQPGSENAPNEGK